MKPLFVRTKNGQPDVQWPKLAAFSTAVMVVTVVSVEALWYVLTSQLSLGALLAAVVIGILIVVRLVVRAVTYQEQELEVELGTGMEVESAAGST